MKAITIFLLTLSFGPVVKAQTVTWEADTPTNFSVTINGTGNGWAGSVTSPSGKWQLTDRGNHAYLSPLGTNFLRFYYFPGAGTVSFVPTGDTLTYEPYVEDVANRVPASDGSSAVFKPAGWYGSQRLTITAQADPLDPATWSYEVHYFGTGPALLQPPGFVTQPQSATASIGATVAFAATVYPPDKPKFFQWRVNGGSLPGHARLTVFSNTTFSSLTITNLQMADAGDYTLVASNSVGVVTSAVARLTLRNIQAWGLNNDGQTVIPDNATNIVAIAAGAYHCLALRSDGTVIGWGENSLGETTPPNTLNDAIALAAGWGFSLALKLDQTITTWGWSEVDTNHFPTGLTDVKAITAGWDHAVALRGDGTVLAWGQGPHGQTSIPGNWNHLVAISANGRHTLGLRDDSSVVACGDDGSAQTNVPLAMTNVAAVAAGGSHDLVLHWDGTVSAWGDDSSGQAAVPPGLTNIVAISGGGFHSLALRDDGTVVAWGWNGDGETNVPVNVTNVVAIAAGRQHNLALMGDGSPKITVEPFDAAVVPGGIVRIGAMAVGTPPLDYQWFKDGQALSEGMHFRNVKSRMLCISNFVSGDAGIYTMFASNSVGATLTRPAHLTIPNLRFDCIRRTTDGQIALRIRSQPGDVLRVQSSSNLFDWETISTQTNATGCEEWTNAPGNDISRFYRLVMP